MLGLFFRQKNFASANTSRSTAHTTTQEAALTAARTAQAVSRMTTAPSAALTAAPSAALTAAPSAALTAAPSAALNAALTASLAAVLAATALTSCAFSENGDETALQTLERTRREEAVSKKLTEANVFFRYEELPTPGDYELVIDWPQSILDIEIRQADRETVMLHRTNSEPASYRQRVRTEETTKLALIAHSSLGGAVSSYEFQATAPKDFIITAETKPLESDTAIDVNRVFILPKGRLVTAGHALSIRTNKLFVLPSEKTDSASNNKAGNDKDGSNTADNNTADNSKAAPFRAHILTYDQRAAMNQGATFGTAVQAPANITINAGYATGPLTVAMIGKTGAAGRSGDALVKEAQVQDRRVFNMDLLRGDDGVPGVKVFKVGPRCGRSGPEMVLNCGQDLSYCSQQPGPGQKGKPGYRGYDGEVGGRGGDTGDLYLNITNVENFAPHIYLLPGEGGAGGAAGHGTEGGAGGAPGKSAERCAVNTTHGAKGEPGQDGNPGARGPRGEEGNITRNYPGQNAVIERL